MENKDLKKMIYMLSLAGIIGFYQYRKIKEELASTKAELTQVKSVSMGVRG